MEFVLVLVIQSNHLNDDSLSLRDFSITCYAYSIRYYAKRNDNFPFTTIPYLYHHKLKYR